MTFNISWKFSQPVIFSSLISEISFIYQYPIQITTVTLLKITQQIKSILPMNPPVYFLKYSKTCHSIDGSSCPFTFQPKQEHLRNGRIFEYQPINTEHIN